MSRTPASQARSAPVPAVDRAARLLFALGDGHGDASLTDLARLLRLHKSTAYNILATLVRHRFVDRDPATRRYRLGPALTALGWAVAGRRGVAYDEMEYLPGVRAVSAPFFQGLEDQGHAIGALSMVGVAARISPQDLRRLAGPLRNAARALSAALHPAIDSGETVRASF